MEKYQFNQMQKKDERVRLITEILNGIKVLKLYGWEQSFVQRIDEIRDQEVHQLKIFQFLEATQFFAWTCAPFMVALFSFAAYVLIGKLLSIVTYYKCYKLVCKKRKLISIYCLRTHYANSSRI